MSPANNYSMLLLSLLLLHSDAVWALGGVGRSPRRPKAFREAMPCEGRRPSRGIRHAAAHLHAVVYSVSTHATPACMLPPLRYTACCCAGDATSPRACARTRCTRGSLRPCVYAHTVHALHARRYAPLCYAQGVCLRIHVHSVHGSYAPLVPACSAPLHALVHERVEANAISLLPTTRRHAVYPQQGTQQLRGLLGSKVVAC